MPPVEHKKIKVNGKIIDAIAVKLLAKNFILLRGSRGYVMCGYLNLRAAGKFNDAAVKITGVSGIGQARKTTVAACTAAARKLGIRKGQPIQDVLKLIA